MKRQEVLSLLERYPEFFDGDDELLHELITDSHPEPAERDSAHEATQCGDPSRTSGLRNNRDRLVFAIAIDCSIFQWSVMARFLRRE